MLWQRAVCSREINDRLQEGGLLIQEDALTYDFSAFAGQAQCVYLDPPLIGGKIQITKQRVGELGWNTSRQAIFTPAFQNFEGHEDYVQFLRNALTISRDLLNETGSLFLHTEEKTLARARLLTDEIFGEDNFRNQIIWSYQTGGRSKRSFSRKHDVILFYAKSPHHFFDITQVPVQRKEANRNHMKRLVDEHGRSYRRIVTGGKEYIYYDDEPVYPDDVWVDVSQMQQKDPQRTGFPGQKPQALLDRCILSTTRPGDLVVDLTCGSGTTLFSAANLGRRFLGIDSSPSAFSICRKRLSPFRLVCQAPFSSAAAMLDASALPGIGYYTVSLHSLTLDEDEFLQFKREPGKLSIQGLDAVDQWHAGLINNGVFTAYASSLRAKQTPALETRLEVPLLRGTVAVLVIDVLGRRTLWTGAPAF